MSSTKIPLLGWVAGFAAVIAGIFAMGLAFLISAPALQVYKGDTEAAKGSWYPRIPPTARSTTLFQA